MTFAAEAQRQQSYRELLVRIRPRRDQTASFVSIGSSKYTVTPPGPVTKVTRNGVALTQDTSAPTVNDHFYFDAASNLLTIRTASAPNASTNIIVVYYCLFYSTTEIVSNLDPADTATQIVQYEPRIRNKPEFGSYFEDVLEGVLTYYDTQIECNHVEALNYLTIADSFNQADVDVWAVINEVENIQKLYSGRVTSLRYVQGVITFNVSDVFNRLRQPAYMGDTADVSYFGVDGFPNVDPNKTGQPIRYVTGRSSRWRQRLIAINNNSLGASEIDPEDTNEAVCTSYGLPTTTTNRTWGLCRMKGVVPNNSFTSLTRVLYLGEHDFSVFVNGTNANYQIGDTFRWVHSGVTYCGVVAVNTAYTLLGDSYNLYVMNCCRQSNGLSATVDGSIFTTSSTSSSTPSMGLSVRYGSVAYFNNWYLRYGADYTRTVTTLPSGNIYVSITLINNFEANDFEDATDLPTELSPQAHQMFYRVTNNAPETHAELLQHICESAGMTVDAASFTQADADFAAETYFSIPTSRELDFESYTKYAQQILKSTLGTLTANEDGEIVYTLIETPAGGDTFSDVDSVMEEVKIDYNDVTTALIGVNEDRASDAEVFEESPASEYLHEIKNIVRFYHVLYSIGTRLADILAIRKHRRVTYTKTVAHTHLTDLLGDDATIEHDDVVGGTGSANVKIVGIRKTVNTISVDSTDLGAP